MPSTAKPAPIPIVDVREGGPVRHATEGRARARALREKCVDWLPHVAAGLLPAMDAANSPMALAIGFALCGGGPHHRGRTPDFPESGFSTWPVGSSNTGAPQ